MNLANAQVTSARLAPIPHAIRFTARTTGLVAAMMISITWLMLVVPLTTAAIPGTDIVPTDWWWSTLLGVVCAVNALAGGYFYAGMLKRRLSFLLCVVLGYLLLMVSSIGFCTLNQQLFVGLATLHVLVGAAAAEWLARRYACRVQEKIEAWPKPARWFVRTTNFWSVFLLGYLGLGVAMHDLMAYQLGTQRFLY